MPILPHYPNLRLTSSKRGGFQTLQAPPLAEVVSMHLRTGHSLPDLKDSRHGFCFSNRNEHPRRTPGGLLYVFCLALYSFEGPMLAKLAGLRQGSRLMSEIPGLWPCCTTRSKEIL